MFSQENPLPQITDSLISLNDSIQNDSIAGDSISIRKQTSPNAINSKINYQATDSIKLSIDLNRVYLYRDVEIKYEDIIVKADYVMIDFDKNTLFAEGVPDSAGNIRGRPVFEQGEYSFVASSMLYNFSTKKGLIKDIITNEGDSYIHGKVVKRFSDNVANIKNGKYTTCDHEHPHYEIKFTKAKVIPDDKIITGPAYLVIEDVPTPLLIPFGYFPNKKGQISGIIIPSYGESANRGFFFERGGYYWGINDYVDLTLQGDIYTRGSWAVYASSNYKKRYRYEGNLILSYAVNIISQKGFSDYNKYKDFSIEWVHKQDPKARPNSSFSANVKAASNSYYKFNSYSTNDYLSNTFESSIAYQASLFGGKANISANIGSKENVQTHELQLWAPQINFSVNTFYPFRKKKKTGPLKWYDNISISYTMNTQNYISTYDTIFLSKRTLDLMQNGMQHSIPIRSSVKVLKYLNWTNSININERWYLRSIKKQWFQNSDTSYIKNDTINKFQMAHEFNISTQLSTRLYGMYQFKKGAIKAIRHVMTPTLSFNYHPDFGTPFWGYYFYAQTDTLGSLQHYSIFQNGIYGTPPDGLSGKLSFSLANNLEMKVRDRKDSVSGTKKVILIDNLSISTGYDFAKDSCNWDYVTVSGRTRLFKRLDINFNGAWDPYYIDTNGTRFNKFEWDVNRRILRRQNTAWMLSFSAGISNNDLTKKDKDGIKQKIFKNEWNLNLSVNLSLSSRFNYKQSNFIPDTVFTCMLTGEFYITPKWKVGFTTGYDFIGKEFSYTSVNIYRDLHCWEMMLEWIPYGFRKSYNFTIRVKSQVLRDLKLEKKSDWRDNF